MPTSHTVSLTSHRAHPKSARILTTFSRAKRHYAGMPPAATIDPIASDGSLWAWCKLVASTGAHDRIVLNGDARLLSLAALLKRLLPGPHAQLIAVDLVLRAPRGLPGRLAARLRRWLWRDVDLFVNYFKDLRGYAAHFGIGEHNSTYLPFKANLYPDAQALAANLPPAQGDYIFAAGRSLRDYPTLIEAARLSGLPVTILFTSHADWAAHGTVVDTDHLPANVTLLQDDGGKSGWLNGLLHARLVVVPTRPESLCASGIGTYLDAMALAKPVIITRGPGADDVLNDSLARFVPPQDALALATAMQQLWADREQARQLGEQGRRYALSLGDEQALLARIFNRATAGR